MGEYFSWVNIDKKEYFSPCDFGKGNKLYENLNVWNPFLERYTALSRQIGKVIISSFREINQMILKKNVIRF